MKFRSGVVTTDLFSANWSGGVPAALPVPGATGWYLAQSGDVQFGGSVYVAGDVELLGTGVIRTAATGKRVELQGFNAPIVFLYTGQTGEVPGTLIAADGASQVGLFAPTTNGNQGRLLLEDEYISLGFSEGGSAPAADIDIAAGSGGGAITLQALTTTIENLGGTAFVTFGTTVVTLNKQLLMVAGSASAPGLAVAGDTDTGLYSPTGNQIAWATNGVQRGLVDSAGLLTITSGRILTQDGFASGPGYAFTNDTDTGMLRPAADTIRFATGGSGRVDITGTVADFFGVSAVRLPVKSTTGDPSGGQNGWLYVNTSDRLLRLFANGSWRTVASW